MASLKISGTAQRTAIIVLAACATMIACSKREANEKELFTPGVQAGGIKIFVDDSASVVAKLGPPEYISTLPTSGSMFMYPKLGMGIQFGGLGTVYHSPLEHDSTVSQVVLVSARVIDDRKFEMSKLRSPEGATLQSTAPDIVRLYGEPPFVQAPVGKRVDDQFTGVVIYPGAMYSFRDGKVGMISLRYAPPADTPTLKRVIALPIVPGKSLGGLEIGMTREQVIAVLGQTRYKYSKLSAEFWLYPQYSIKVQFGVPPVEGARSEQFFDTARSGRVTGLTAISQKLFEGQLCPQSYTGTTPQGLAIGMPSHLIREKLGEPIKMVPSEGGQIQGGFIYLVYDGVVYFVDPYAATIHHILVADPAVPLEIPL